ncbi:unnamed protein product [Amoebophrya sp. A25]|nr:unnamed protein product [Amoebophrya sp. A25]|eukprot:GSA25T00002648001.1
MSEVSPAAQADQSGTAAECRVEAATMESVRFPCRPNASGKAVVALDIPRDYECCPREVCNSSPHGKDGAAWDVYVNKLFWLVREHFNGNCKEVDFVEVGTSYFHTLAQCCYSGDAESFKTYKNNDANIYGFCKFLGYPSATGISIDACEDNLAELPVHPRLTKMQAIVSGVAPQEDEARTIKDLAERELKSWVLEHWKTDSERPWRPHSPGVENNLRLVWPEDMSAPKFRKWLAGRYACDAVSAEERSDCITAPEVTDEVEETDEVRAWLEADAAAKKREEEKELNVDGSAKEPRSAGKRYFYSVKGAKDLRNARKDPKPCGIHSKAYCATCTWVGERAASCCSLDEPTEYLLEILQSNNALDLLQRRAVETRSLSSILTEHGITRTDLLGRTAQC